MVPRPAWGAASRFDFGEREGACSSFHKVASRHLIVNAWMHYQHNLLNDLAPSPAFPSRLHGVRC
jgi:hypothetical protein